MRLIVVGVHWKSAPVTVRERLVIEPARLPTALAQLRAQHPATEFAALSTCNRTELYAARLDDDCGADSDDLAEFLAHFHQVPATDFLDHWEVHEDRGGVLHLFRVASGLDSMVLGESQIIGQVRAAYDAAMAEQTAGPVLHGLFQKAFAVAKRVQTDTGLGKGRISIGSAAVEHIRGVFDTFADKSVVMVGTGEMGMLTLTHLKDLEPAKILIVNRTFEKAEKAAAELGGEARPWEALEATLADGDIIVSCTGAAHRVIDADLFRRVQQKRRGRLATLIDLAVPRDIDPDVGTLDNVLLWNIDHLEKVRKETLRRRQKEIDAAWKITEDEAESFLVEMARRQHGNTIGLLEKEYNQITESELDWLFKQIGDGLTDEQQAKIRQFAHRLHRKFLHPPKNALRAAAPDQHTTRYALADAFRVLFGLNRDE